MPSERDQSLADYVAIALSPALIMALVGSLVFFLLEILYVGEFYGNLKWVFFFFVFGAVLVARISMRAEIANRAGLYGAVLGLLAWAALLRFVEYPRESKLAPWGWAINAGLIILIWWCAHRLTWDCTLIDEAADASGVGLLEVAGLEQPNQAAVPAADNEKAPATRKKKDKAPGGLAGWWQRYQQYRQQRKQQPQAPGVWVVYFSLAALPLFGLGQAQIPPDEVERRRYTFWLMLIYSGSGLGLLLTTCFLGLRRYLRQRKLKMPAAMTGVWIVLGAILVGAFLIVAAILPRPGDPTPLLQWAGLGNSESRKAHSNAKIGKGGKDKADSSSPKDAKDDGDKDGKQDENGGESDSDKKDKKDKKGKKTGDKDDDEKGSHAGSGEKQGSGSGSKKNDTRRQSRDPPTPPSPSGLFQKLAEILKWVAIVVIGLIVLWMFLRHLANFTSWASNLLAALRKWWANLWKREAKLNPGVAAPAPAPPTPPFTSFSDPFLTGAADRMSPEELVRYSFAALEAWAHARQVGRQTGETPLEFVHRLSDEAPALEADMRRLGEFYVALAYAARPPDAAARDAMRQFWHELNKVGGQARAVELV